MTERLTIIRAATHETELGDHNFCLSRSHYTDTNLTSRIQGKELPCQHTTQLNPDEGKGYCLLNPKLQAQL